MVRVVIPYIFFGGELTIRFAYNGEDGGYAPVMVLNKKDRRIL